MVATRRIPMDRAQRMTEPERIGEAVVAAMRRIVIEYELRGLGFADDLLFDGLNKGVDLLREPETFAAVVQDLEQVRPLNLVVFRPLALTDSGASTRCLESGLSC